MDRLDCREDPPPYWRRSPAHKPGVVRVGHVRNYPRTQEEDDRASDVRRVFRHGIARPRGDKFYPVRPFSKPFPPIPIGLPLWVRRPHGINVRLHAENGAVSLV